MFELNVKLVKKLLSQSWDFKIIKLNMILYIKPNNIYIYIYINNINIDEGSIKTYIYYHLQHYRFCWHVAGVLQIPEIDPIRCMAGRSNIARSVEGTRYATMAARSTGARSV